MSGRNRFLSAETQQTETQPCHSSAECFYCCAAFCLSLQFVTVTAWTGHLSWSRPLEALFQMSVQHAFAISINCDTSGAHWVSFFFAKTKSQTLV